MLEQLILHGVGDYVTQSNWMANEKTKRSWPLDELNVVPDDSDDFIPFLERIGPVGRWRFRRIMGRLRAQFNRRMETR